jgi:hypothetical protein
MVIDASGSFDAIRSGKVVGSINNERMVGESRFYHHASHGVIQGPERC